MKIRSRLIAAAAVLLAAVFIHASSALAEETSTPEGAVKAFAQQYFMLDSAMADYLTRDALFNEHDVNLVDLYFYKKEQEARDRGYDIDYLKMRPILMKTRVLEQDEDTAVIEFSGVVIRSINPLYRIVGYVFGLIQEHEVRTTLTVVKEDGSWKVGPGAFDLPV
jgi:hypothetical protein